MTVKRIIPFALLLLTSACSRQEPKAGGAEPGGAAPVETSHKAASASPRIATWSGPPAGRLAVTSGRLAVQGGCIVLNGEGGARGVAFPRDAVSWDAEKKGLVLAGALFPLDREIGLAGGSIDTSKAADDPVFALEGCSRGPLLFVAERLYPDPPAKAR